MTIVFASAVDVERFVDERARLTVRETPKVSIEIPESRARRLAVRYMTCKAQARNMASTAGREARKLHEEARIIEEVSQALLGPDAWSELLDELSARA